jgi:hypothetical protein
MPKTLNKNGVLRKVGSGKTKGAGCYANVTWKKLKEMIAEDVNIPVSRVWLRNIGVTEIPKVQKKKPVSAALKSNKNTEELPVPKITHIHKKRKPAEEVNDEQADGEYSPPPLFAIGENNLNQY